MVRSAVNNAFLNTLTVGMLFPCIPAAFPQWNGVPTRSRLKWFLVRDIAQTTSSYIPTFSVSSSSWLFWYTNAYTRQLCRALLRNFISHLLKVHQRLRSASTSSLVVPRTRLSTIGNWALPVAAARLWNTLPLNATSASSISVFRKHLKTNFFSHSFPEYLVVPVQWLCYFRLYNRSYLLTQSSSLSWISWSS